MHRSLFLACALLSACASQKSSDTAEQNTVTQPASKQNNASKPKRAPTPMAPVVNGQLVWEGPVEWTDWETAQNAAKDSGKYTLLVVYSHGCPRCRELAAAFNDAELGALSKQVSMVRATDMEAPKYREIIGKYPSYVPRLFFVSPEGTVREDLVSSHPKYPYFYTVGMIDELKAHLKAVAK